MITWGFVPSYSDVVVLDQPFTQNGLTFTATYIIPGTDGNIVWENNKGEAQYLPNALQGQTYILGACKILTSGVVNGTSRVTSASNLVWMSGTQKYNSP